MHLPLDEQRLVLAASVLSAVNTANAARPFDRRGRASMLCFGTGMPTSELPLETLAAHLAVTAVAAARGDLRSGVGVVSGVLAAASAAGLVGLHRATRSAAPALEAAVAEAMGADYREHVAQPRFPGPDAATASAPGIVRMLRIRRRFAHDADLSYGPAGRANHLDVWAREDLPRDARAPVLVQVPGGAWVTGDKQGQAYPLMSHLAERGWVCVSLSYRLGPRNRWPAQIVDVKRAIAWVREHIAGHGGDPDFIALTGGSAGGHLSSLAALTPNDPAWQPGFEDADTRVAATVPFYGVYDLLDEERLGHKGLLPLLQRHVFDVRRRDHPEVYRAASPLHRVTVDAPPFFVVHGTNDSLVPIEQARLFARRLRDTSHAPVGYAEVPGAQHAFDFFASPRATAAARAVADFLGVVYGRYLARASARGRRA